MKAKILLLLLPLLLTLPAGAAVSPIRITVEQSSKTATKKTTAPKGKTTTTATGGTQIRSLLIKLENHSQDTFDNLVVKYWFFGHDAKAHDAKPIRAGQRKSFLGPNGRETVDSETVSIQYTPEHFEKSSGRSGRGGAGNGKNRNRTATKKVAASGTKVTGYAVQVFKGGSIVAEYYSEASYKAKVGTAAPSLSEPTKAKPAGKSKKPKRK